MILATWRLTSLLHSESGPYDILGKLRYLLGVRYNELSLPYATTEAAEGVLCFWCCSVWCGALLAILSYLAGDIKLWQVPVKALSFSAGAILVEEILNDKGEHLHTT